MLFLKGGSDDNIAKTTTTKTGGIDLLKFESLVEIQSGKKILVEERKKNNTLFSFRSDQIGWAFVCVVFFSLLLSYSFVVLAFCGRG